MIKQQNTSNNIEVQKLATYKVLLGEAINTMKQIGLCVDILKYNVFLGIKCHLTTELLKYNDGDVEKSMSMAQEIVEKFMEHDYKPQQEANKEDISHEAVEEPSSPQE